MTRKSPLQKRPGKLNSTMRWVSDNVFNSFLEYLVISGRAQVAYVMYL